jgi:hypothetical protein
MMRLSFSPSLLTTRNSISPLRSSRTAGCVWRRGQHDTLCRVGFARDTYLLREWDSRHLERLLHVFLGWLVELGALLGRWRRRLARRLTLHGCHHGTRVRKLATTAAALLHQMVIYLQSSFIMTGALLAKDASVRWNFRFPHTGRRHSEAGDRSSVGPTVVGRLPREGCSLSRGEQRPCVPC